MRRLDQNETLEMKAAIVRAGLRLHRVATAAGITADRLSKILCGVRPPHKGELTRVAAAIKRLASGR